MLSSTVHVTLAMTWFPIFCHSWAAAEEREPGFQDPISRLTQDLGNAMAGTRTFLNNTRDGVRAVLKHVRGENRPYGQGDDFLSDGLWPSFKTPSQSWAPAEIGMFKEDDINAISQGFSPSTPREHTPWEGVRQYVSQVLKGLGPLADPMQARKAMEFMMKKMVQIKDFAQLIMNLNDPKVRRALWESVREDVEEGISVVEERFRKILTGNMTFSEYLASPAGKDLMFTYRVIYSHSKDNDGRKKISDELTKGLTWGFRSTYNVILAVHHPRATEDGGLETYLMLYLVATGGVVWEGMDPFYAEMSTQQDAGVSVLVKKDKDGDYHLPGVYYDSTYGGYGIALYTYRLLGPLSKTLFSKATRSAKSALSPLLGKSLASKLKLQSSSRTRRGGRQETGPLKASDAFWNAASGRLVKENAGIYGYWSYTFWYDVTKMIEKDPTLLLTVLTLEVIGNLVGVGAGLASLPLISAVTGGLGKMVGVDSVRQLGSFVGDALTIPLPSMHEYQEQFALVRVTGVYNLRYTFSNLAKGVQGLNIKIRFIWWMESWSSTGAEVDVFSPHKILENKI